MATVIEREINEWDEFTGRMQAVETVEIRPRVSGYIQKKVAFAEGKEVRKGDVLFVIDPRPYRAELDRAAAELERARTRAELANSDFERAQTLIAKEAISREEFDLRASALKESRAAIRAAEAQVADARLGPVPSVPLFDLGRVKARVGAARARADEAQASYDQTVLLALEEVETALVSYDRARARLTHLREAAAASERAVELARLRFDEGVTDFLQVLDAERTMLEAQDRLARGRTDAVTAFVALYRALGGAWPVEGPGKR